MMTSTRRSATWLAVILMLLGCGCAGEAPRGSPGRRDGLATPDADAGVASDGDVTAGDATLVPDGAPPPPPDKGALPPPPDKGAPPPPDKGPPVGGYVYPPVKDPYPSEADTLFKCAASTMQWWKSPTESSRDVTFVAFADPHETGMEPGCKMKSAYASNQAALMRAAVNSVETSPHVWPAGPGFYREGKVYDHVRGVLVAGDLTNTGSDAWPVGTQLGHDCKEYTAYRAAYGRCGSEGKLKFPIYEGYGNHEFPVVVGSGDASYHPVVDDLDMITQSHRPGSTKDLYDDPTPGTGHFAWRWDDIWFVNLNLKPGNKNEVIPKTAATRIAAPHDARTFLINFLSTRTNNKTRQIVLMSHYGLNSSRIEAAERVAFCKVINDARNGTGPFSGQKLSKSWPVVAQIHGHNHNAPLYKPWTCPSPYGAIVIPRFEVGTPLYKSADNGGKLHFTVFRLGSNKLEAVGVGALATNPTGKWTYAHKTRLAVMSPP